MTATLFLTDFDEVGVNEGPIYLVPARNEDDPYERFDYFIEVMTPDGKIFRLSHAYQDRAAAEKKVKFVKARGCLNLEHWHEVEVMSLEEKFDLYAEHEWEVAHGYRAEHDLYHGLP
jgi:hypothetical protein